MGDGVAIPVHKSISFKEHKELNILYKGNFECIFLKLKYKSNKPVIIGLIYQPPNTRPKDFCKQYQIMIDKLRTERGKEIILGMDHNLDLLKSNTHPDTQKFLDINFNGDIYSCITRPT